ncbi:helix-turn-helix domain-containing protein [Desulfoscipio geothermicus]|uniref:HTH iclR-type domain-containing protein n=1 Tax=Desulfoscipio geothermicus DSM 3669 TaxID=1121426 RepID=A0A1I6E265_9FIRM|nr:helix-turn-helix domain-containing protein [Desulfoscipio geothermicus]SFR11608.1 hypothetical protein SAMN05660706_12322 [Desulfoscipio geothermicus DSM 3669]
MRDSPFAYFDDVAPGPLKEARGQILNLSPRALAALELLRASGAALTTTMLARYLGCKKPALQRNMYALQRAGLAYRLDCLKEGRYVRVWLASTVPLPGPGEAARLAALGLLFLRLRREQPGMIWEMLPRQAVRMTINNTRLVDPVRRGEKPGEKADLLLFPTLDEARRYTPEGKLYTTDTMLLSDDSQIIFKQTGR